MVPTAGNINNGTGIFALGGAHLNVTGLNTFTDNRHGIAALAQSASITVTDNTFNDLFLGLAVSSYDSPAPNRVVTVSGNVMDDVTVGINCHANPLSHISIVDNDLTGDMAAPVTLGINVTETQPNPQTAVDIVGNTVQGMTMGILAQQLTGFWTTSIMDNTVTGVRNNEDEQASGIQAAHVSGAIIANNLVDGGSTGYNWWQHGIRHDHGIMNWITCNTSREVGNGLFLGGAMAPSAITRNEVRDNGFAGMLFNWSNWGDIGTLAQAYDNTWQGTFSTEIGHTHTLETNALDWKIYYRNGEMGPPFEPTVNSAWPSDLDIYVAQESTSSSPFSWTCPEDVGTQMPVSDEEIAELLVKALTDTVTQPTYHGERRWISKAGIYELLAHNDTVREADSLLIAFHDSCHSANIGKLMRIQAVAGWPLVENVAGKLVPMPAETLQVHLDTLNSISTSIVPEAALKEVLIIAVEHLLDTALVVDSMETHMSGLIHSVFPDSTFVLPSIGKKPLSGTHRSALESIALECPYEYGTGVYMARAMLSVHDTIPYLGSHECERPTAPPSERRGEEEVPDEDITSEDALIRVYPNPAQLSLFVEISLEEGERAYLELYGITGNLLGKEVLTSGRNAVDISAYASGLYFFTVSINGKPVHNGKQVIMR